MGRRHLRQILWMLAALALQTGCEPMTRHRLLTTFFDDVPSLPPVEQYCREAAEKKAQSLAAVQTGAARHAPTQSSVHLPYGEKRCNDCHQTEKTSISGLVKPETELCFMCHAKILKHAFTHGPAAEGACLACHLPHEASNPSLLIREPGKLCDKCHGELRIAAGMHDKIKASGVICLDCHDPHSGDSKYFLK